MYNFLIKFSYSFTRQPFHLYPNNSQIFISDLAPASSPLLWFLVSSTDEQSLTLLFTDSLSPHAFPALPWKHKSNYILPPSSCFYQVFCHGEKLLIHSDIYQVFLQGYIMFSRVILGKKYKQHEAYCFIIFCINWILLPQVCINFLQGNIDYLDNITGHFVFLYTIL